MEKSEKQDRELQIINRRHQDSDTTSPASSGAANDAGKANGRSKAPFCGFGIFCGIMAGLIYSFNTLLVKMVESSEAFQLSAARCIVQSLLLVPYASYQWWRNDVDIIGSPEMFKFLLLRAITGSTGSILLYQSIQRLSVGDSVTLMFTSTVFAAILGCLFLKERLSILEGFMIIITMAGVVLISKPAIIFGGGDYENTGELIAGLAFGLSSGFLNGCTMVVLRKLGKQKISPSLNILYYSLVGSFTSSLMVAATDSFRLPCLRDLPFISMLGLTGIGGQIFLSVGLQYERAAVFPAIRSLQIVFVYILQVRVICCHFYFQAYRIQLHHSVQDSTEISSFN